MKNKSDLKIVQPNKSSITLPVFAACLGLALSAQAVVIVDDTWADGTRTNQNLPTESAWFTSRPTHVSVGTGFLSLTNEPTSSSEWVTYFTDSGTPVNLDVGDTLTVTLEFTVSGVGAQNSSQNFRVGIADSSAGTRATEDGTVPAVNYTGYALFGNFGATWGRNDGIELRKRSNLTSGNLLSSSGDWTPFSTGGGGTTTGTPAFNNDVPYTLTFTFTRDGADSMSLTATYTSAGTTNTFTEADTSNIYTNFDTFLIRPSGATTTATNFVFTRFKVEGPGATPQPPTVLVQPQDMTLTVGQNASFTVGVGGTPPLFYQWHFISNFTTNLLAGATNDTLTLQNVQTNQSGGYFVVVTNAQGADTSMVATLTVNEPVVTPGGLVVDDTWQDGTRVHDGAVTTSNTLWYASNETSLSSTVGSMTGTPASGSSRLWVGYFTDSLVTFPVIPVHLSVGRTIKATVVFTPTNVVASGGNSMRFGVFNYSDGGTRLTDDNFGSGSTGNGQDVRGYMLVQNFGATFNEANPMEIYARNNLSSGNLMGSTGDYVSLGEGPAESDYTGAPAFVSGTEYTLEFSVTRLDVNEVQITTRISGGGTNWTTTVTDDTFAYHRFDSFGIRPNTLETTADSFTFTQFKVEVLEIAVPFSITTIERLSPDAVKLTWDSLAGQTYHVRSRDTINAAGWTTNGTVNATGSSSSFTNTGLTGVPQRFYQVLSP